MKLEKRHITPYLEHDLIVMYDGVPCRLEGIDLKFYPTAIIEQRNMDLSDIKLILRPMSDLNKEIKHNGKRFIPSKQPDVFKALKGMHPSAAALKPYHVVRKLLEWHFDIFGLIDAGLAVDVNTLKK